MKPRLLLKLVLALALASCGSKSLRGPARQPPPAAGSLPPLPRSSIAAVLEHREDLQLTPRQVQLLEEYDEKLAARNSAVRDGTALQAQKKPDPTPAPATTPSAPASHGGLTAGPGVVPGAGGKAPRRHRAAEDTRSPEDIDKRIDDNDTRAYLEAEEMVLAPEQRERARDIAEDYREKLYDRRERLGRRGDSD